MGEELKTYNDVRKKIESNREMVNTEIHLLSPPVQEAVNSTFDICFFLVNKVEELDNKINKNSSNSSNPPSTDPKKKPNSSRGKTGKNTGGQPGHKGSNLRRVENPSLVIEHKPQGKCRCGMKVGDLPVVHEQSRQVFEIEVVNKVVEHQTFSTVCSCGETHCGEFPEDVSGSTQYGASVRGIVTYLSKYQLIPSERLSQMMEDIFNYPLSEGTVDNIKNESAESLHSFEEKMKEAIQEEKIINVDETPVQVNGTKGYMHVACNEALTYIAYQAKRGMEAVMNIGVLDKFKGILIHDCFSMYFNYGSSHGICNAHLSRELKFIEEQYKYNWATEAKNLLWEAYDIVQMSKADGIRYFDSADCDELSAEFESILQRGRTEMKSLIQAVPTKGKKRGKQHPALNLCNRMLRLKKEILLFLYDHDVPFTNNEAERDLRMTKVQVKVSGGFRTEEGARGYALLRSYIQTMKKQGLGILEGLTNLFISNKNPTLDQIFYRKTAQPC